MLCIKKELRVYLGFKSNAIQVGRLFLLHTPSTLLVIRIVYEDFVWMLKAKKKRGINPRSLPVSPHYQCTEQADDCKWYEHDVVLCYCGIHRKTTERKTTECRANCAKCIKLHMYIVFKMKRSNKKRPRITAQPHKPSFR